MILADEPHLMLYEVKDPQSLPTWPRENSLPNQLRQSVITLYTTYKEISCCGQSLMLQGKAINNNEKKQHTEIFVHCAREEMKRNLPWSSSDTSLKTWAMTFGSVNCLNKELLAISFWVQRFPLKERDKQGQLHRDTAVQPRLSKRLEAITTLSLPQRDTLMFNRPRSQKVTSYFKTELAELQLLSARWKSLFYQVSSSEWPLSLLFN